VGGGTITQLGSKDLLLSENVLDRQEKDFRGEVKVFATKKAKGTRLQGGRPLVLTNAVNLEAWDLARLMGPYRLHRRGIYGLTGRREVNLFPGKNGKRHQGK